MRVLAIDQGTTSTRGVVFDGDSPPRLVVSRRHRQFYPAPGLVEHDPLELLADVRACIEGAGPVDAIGIANQGESCLAWDAVDGTPLSPVIVWQDRRAADSIEALRVAGYEPAVRAATGMPLDSYFAAAKLGWIMRTLPAAARAHAAGRLRLGTTDAYLLDRLAGAFATDVTTASRTSLMRLADAVWDMSLCALFGVPGECLPPIRASDAGFGAVGGVPIVASLVDQQAALRGHGATRRGDAKITFGTGAFALMHAGSVLPAAADDGLIVTVASADRSGTGYAIEGGVFDAGAAIEWARRLGLIDDPAAIAWTPGSAAADAGLFFVPALSGLGCPEWRRDAGALWCGMTAAASRSDLQRSILEGIALQTASVIDALERRAGIAAALSVDGGLSANDGFLQFLADASGRAIRRAGSPELTAYGCALQAGHRGAAPVPGTLFTPQIPEGRRTGWRAGYAAAVRRALE